MPRRLALALAVAVAPSVVSAGRDVAHVRFTTPKRAYLDAGKLDGIALGDKLKLSRNGAAAGTCTVDQLADHHASCTGDNVHVGDTYPVTRPPPPPAPKPSSVGAGPAVDGNVVRQSLAGAPVDKVDFHATGAHAMRGPSLISVSLGHQAYVTFDGDHFQHERLDFSLNGVPMRFGGFRAYISLTALVTSVRPSTQRFRAGDLFQIYVWETAMSSREVGRPFVLSVGRIAPYHTPGLTVVDGVQAGWRSKEGNAEVGVVGGLIPDMMTMYPTYDHWTAGVYYGVSHHRRAGSIFRTIRHEARLSVRGSPTINGPQLELEGLTQVWFRRIADAAVQTRVVMGGNGGWAPSLDAARVSLGLQPTKKLRIQGRFRYLGPRGVDYDNLFNTAPMSSGSWYYGDGDVLYDAASWITVAASIGASYDTSTSLGRQYMGPEIVFPRVGRIGSVSIGYREELGWLSGRDVHAQLTLAPMDRVRFMLRASYFEDAATGSPLREVGVFGFVEGRLTSWLALRTSAMSRVAVQGAAADGRGIPAGLNLRADLTGTY